MNIFLIGYRGTGKTTVGRPLADRLGWSFIDTDLELIDQLKMSIAEFVHRYDWHAFRKRERDVICRVCTLDKQVVATGGGVVLDARNVESMHKSGLIVCLKASPETIKRRLIADKFSSTSRPGLSSKGLVEEIEEMLQHRAAYYEQAMDFAVETDRLGNEDICSLIIDRLPRLD